MCLERTHHWVFENIWASFTARGLEMLSMMSGTRNAVGPDLRKGFEVRCRVDGVVIRMEGSEHIVLPSGILTALPIHLIREYTTS